LADAATPTGDEILAEISSQPATREQIAAATAAVETAASHMGRTMPTSGLKELLYRNVENPRWDALAERCLSCANCTLVCPTCFCSTVEDCTDLAGQRAERIRKWDSCFTTDFSYIHGGSVRATPRSKFRQWMMHKLAYWNDQFGTSGCTGCGRCITWCPVGIDITEEVRAIRDSEATASISL
jgi:ferredoxin